MVVRAEHSSYDGGAARASTLHAQLPMMKGEVRTEKNFRARIFESPRTLRPARDNRRISAKAERL